MAGAENRFAPSFVVSCRTRDIENAQERVGRLEAARHRAGQRLDNGAARRIIQPRLVETRVSHRWGNCGVIPATVV